MLTAPVLALEGKGRAGMHPRCDMSEEEIFHQALARTGRSEVCERPPWGERKRGPGRCAGKQVPPQPETIPAIGLCAGAMACSLYRRPAFERRNEMLFSCWLQNWKRSRAPRRWRTSASARQEVRLRPRLQAFEDRCLPSGVPYPTAATVSQLVADINYADKTGGTFTIQSEARHHFRPEKRGQ